MQPSNKSKEFSFKETTFRPYIPAEAKLREFTFLPIIFGTILGIVFGASSLYLVLKVGMTVSASIPVAVISIALFRVLSKIGLKNATILENNIVQTTGSAGESIAFGVGVTMPAIMILGFDLEIARVLLVAVLGGLLGILMMIPLRKALIVEQHGTLKYPEGTACAVVLQAAASDESKKAAQIDAKSHGIASEIQAKPIFTGLGIGFLYMTIMQAFKGWKDVPEKVFGTPFKSGSIAAEISPALLGVGYIIGPRISAIMCSGGVLAYLVLIPMIKFFGEHLTSTLPPGTIPIGEMSPHQIRGAYILYIGAGAVAAGGLVSLLRSLPIIWYGLKGGIKDFKSNKENGSVVLRTEQDLSMKFVLGGIIALMIAIVAAKTLHMNILGASLIIIFGFLFVLVSSRITGEVGSSSNPISGMTVATLLLTCLVFLIVGWTGPTYFITALSVGAIVCIAASNGGTISQDLKTGYLVGATPRLQQIAILIGAFASAIILGPILINLNKAATIYVPKVTYEKAENITISIPKEILTTLPVYSESHQPDANKTNYLLNTKTLTGITNLNPGEYLVNELGQVTHKIQYNFPENLTADISTLAKKEKLTGPQGLHDQNTYHVWQKTDDASAPAGRYLVDDAGKAVYLVDPGINGIYNVRPDGSTVTKFDAPKATLMSYIIKGILDRKLPWALVILGVMIALVLEMCGIGSLVFAVGVYLPLSSSSPILVGGFIRWLVDLYIRKKHKDKNLTEEQLTAEGDKSSGVLMASGYIAGGALAGIIIAFMAGTLTNFNRKIDIWANENNPLFNGPYADILSLIPFAILTLLLYFTGRELILKGNNKKSTI
jgi:putative OPT family oligopeptide transporter